MTLVLIGIIAGIWIILFLWKCRKNSLSYLYKDSRRREEAGEKWEEYHGDGR